jgi:uncharacterized protein YjbJ (UPF0337 family)
MALRHKVRNLLRVSKGKAKETVGKVTDNPHLETEGVSDQRTGNLNQAGEKVKDAFRKH